MSSGSKQLTIKDQLKSQSFLAEVANALPRHISAERFARVTITALAREPKLAECDQRSFFKALMDMASSGLEPDGRRAHLIPFKNNQKGIIECQLILDYKGLVELAYRSGFVRNIHADVVRDGDLFEYSLGQVRKHTPWAFIPREMRSADPGEIIAAYCIVEMKDGASKHEVMTRMEIDSIRARSKAGRSGPWVTDFPEMAKKTVFRRVSKWLPLSSEVMDAFDRDFDRMPAIEHRPRATVDMAALLSDAGSDSGSKPELLEAEPETEPKPTGVVTEPGDGLFPSDGDYE